MANLFRMSTGGGGTVSIDPSPYGTGIKAVITGEAPLNAEQATLDATANPAVESDIRKWNITSGSDIEDVITLETEIWTPSTVVNVALDDGVASHTRATASNVVTGKYFWDADGEYKVGTGLPANISTSYETILSPTLITRNGVMTYYTIELSKSLRQDAHAFYVIIASPNTAIYPKMTKGGTRGVMIVPKSEITQTSNHDFFYHYLPSDNQSSDGTIWWKYVDDTHLAFANQSVKDLYVGVYAIPFAA